MFGVYNKPPPWRRLGFWHKAMPSVMEIMCFRKKQVPASSRALADVECPAMGLKGIIQLKELRTCHPQMSVSGILTILS